MAVATNPAQPNAARLSSDPSAAGAGHNARPPADLTKDQLATVESERDALAHKVAGLDPNHVDPDLLDQQIRATLDLVAPNEIVIVPPGQPGAPH